MGLDLGTKRIGVAISDEFGWTAQGLTVIEHRSWLQTLEKIGEIMSQYEVEEVVVGYPKNMDGSVGSRARSAEAFAEEIRKKLGVPVFLWDERLSTVAAENSLLEAGVRREKRKKVVDKLAAVVILQSYLESKGVSQ